MGRLQGDMKTSDLSVSFVILVVERDYHKGHKEHTKFTKEAM